MLTNGPLDWGLWIGFSGGIRLFYVPEIYSSLIFVAVCVAKGLGVGCEPSPSGPGEEIYFFGEELKFLKFAWVRKWLCIPLCIENPFNVQW